jgi:hypothetical protein
MDLTALFGFTPDYDRCFGTPESIMMNLEPSTRNIGIVLPITSTMHIKTMAQ